MKSRIRERGGWSSLCIAGSDALLRLKRAFTVLLSLTILSESPLPLWDEVGHIPPDLLGARDVRQCLTALLSAKFPAINNARDKQDQKGFKGMGRVSDKVRGGVEVERREWDKYDQRQ
jgi:hypothetical protein